MTGLEPIGPSAVLNPARTASAYGQPEQPRPMTEEDIRRVRDAFAAAASRPGRPATTEWKSTLPTAIC